MSWGLQRSRRSALRVSHSAGGKRAQNNPLLLLHYAENLSQDSMGLVTNWTPCTNRNHFNYLNKSGKMYSSEYTDTPEVSFKPHNGLWHEHRNHGNNKCHSRVKDKRSFGHCCTNVIQGHRQKQQQSRTSTKSGLRPEIHRFPSCVLCNAHSEELNLPLRIKQISPNQYFVPIGKHPVHVQVKI
jgi:hypothetical protein